MHTRNARLKLDPIHAAAYTARAVSMTAFCLDPCQAEFAVVPSDAQRMARLIRSLPKDS